MTVEDDGSTILVVCCMPDGPVSKDIGEDTLIPVSNKKRGTDYSICGALKTNYPTEKAYGATGHTALSARMVCVDALHLLLACASNDPRHVMHHVSKGVSQVTAAISYARPRQCQPLIELEEEMSGTETGYAATRRARGNGAAGERHCADIRYAAPGVANARAVADKSIPISTPDPKSLDTGRNVLEEDCMGVLGTTRTIQTLTPMIIRSKV
eukprot:3931694-Rhodomonas_salina.1